MRFVPAVFLDAVLIAMVAIMPAGLRAQQTNSRPELDLAFTYSAQRSNLTAGSSFWAQGGSAELSAAVFHGLGLAANVIGINAGNRRSSGVSLSMVTASFGPRYTLTLPAHPRPEMRMKLFGEALIGIESGIDSVFPTVEGPQSSANDFALQIIGGADCDLTRHLAVRPAQATWLRTQLPTATRMYRTALNSVPGLSALR